jgi:hypothetical protein
MPAAIVHASIAILTQVGIGADAAVLADEIDDAPPSIALLNVDERQRRHFRSPESAADLGSHLFWCGTSLSPLVHSGGTRLESRSKVSET